MAEVALPRTVRSQRGNVLVWAWRAFDAHGGFQLAASIAYYVVFSFVAILLVYRNGPNVDHGLHNVGPAALFATVIFESSKHLFAYYVAHFNQYHASYGALVGVMLFMLWTYLSAIVLLVGAELASATWQLRAIRRAAL